MSQRDAPGPSRVLPGGSAFRAVIGAHVLFLRNERGNERTPHEQPGTCGHRTTSGSDARRMPCMLCRAILIARAVWGSFVFGFKDK